MNELSIVVQRLSPFPHFYGKFLWTIVCTLHLKSFLYIWYWKLSFYPTIRPRETPLFVRLANSPPHLIFTLCITNSWRWRMSNRIWGWGWAGERLLQYRNHRWIWMRGYWNWTESNYCVSLRRRKVVHAFHNFQNRIWVSEWDFLLDFDFGIFPSIHTF